MLLDGNGDGWRATFRRMPLDPTPVLAEFERQNFQEQCGVVGRLVMEEFRTAQLCLTPFLHWKAVAYPDAPLTNDLLHAFNRIDKRAFMSAQHRTALVS